MVDAATRTTSSYEGEKWAEQVTSVTIVITKNYITVIANNNDQGRVEEAQYDE